MDSDSFRQRKRAADELGLSSDRTVAACVTKVAYGGEHAAVEAGIFALKNNPAYNTLHALSVYECLVCGQWHRSRRLDYSLDPQRRAIITRKGPLAADYLGASANERIEALLAEAKWFDAVTLTEESEAAARRLYRLLAPVAAYYGHRQELARARDSVRGLLCGLIAQRLQREANYANYFNLAAREVLGREFYNALCDGIRELCAGNEAPEDIGVGRLKRVFRHWFGEGVSATARQRILQRTDELIARGSPVKTPVVTNPEGHLPEPELEPGLQGETVWSIADTLEQRLCDYQREVAGLAQGGVPRAKLMRRMAPLASAATAIRAKKPLFEPGGHLDVVEQLLQDAERAKNAGSSEWPEPILSRLAEKIAPVIAEIGPGHWLSQQITRPMTRLREDFIPSKVSGLTADEVTRVLAQCEEQRAHLSGKALRSVCVSQADVLIRMKRRTASHHHEGRRLGNAISNLQATIHALDSQPDEAPPDNLSELIAAALTEIELTIANLRGDALDAAIQAACARLYGFRKYLGKNDPLAKTIGRKSWELLALRRAAIRA